MKTETGQKVIYIAGPYRDERGEFYVRQNIRAAEQEAVYVWETGGVALCPHKNTAGFGGVCPDSWWLMGDLELLLRCDAVYAIPGWEKSRGAYAEVDFAKGEGIPVLYDRKQVKEFIFRRIIMENEPHSVSKQVPSSEEVPQTKVDRNSPEFEKIMKRRAEKIKKQIKDMEEAQKVTQELLNKEFTI